ncbi:hypothetical protein ElyMa_002049900 [Elysia marginata]|uniref:Laminin G domain-containing protein n=1 Tax=Elysia marginata TaxID=1093978 RepID=A0AAV4F9I5_9GAST|nr:hypothetical protein ElyMa_002049900 [Elysia marginata]
MDMYPFAVFLALLVGLVCAVAGDPCFTFNGEGYLRFNLHDFDNSGPAHYSLKFRTRSNHGLLIYSETNNGDDEALFIRDGMLVYHIFNSSPHGVEGYFGGRFLGTVPVNTGEEVEVHMYRGFDVTDSVQRRTHQQTGLVYTVGGRTYTHVDFWSRSGIVLDNEVYVGGFKQSLSDTVGNFTGQISGIREEKNNALFRTFSQNAGGNVDPHCINFTPV